MDRLDRDALDRHITDGRFTTELIDVTCANCGKETTVLCETDYGSSEWSELTCSHCGEDFNGSETTSLAERPDDS